MTVIVDTFKAFGATSAPITLSAPWANIQLAENPSPPPEYIAASRANANVTLTLTGTRTAKVTYDVALTGTLNYRINSGTYTTVASGGTFSVTNGDTLNFQYNETAGEGGNINFIDDATSSVIDTFSYITA
jgi:hypothetical protein